MSIMTKLYGIVFFLLVADYASSTLRPYVFEFGQNSGSVLATYDGTIPLLKLNTKKEVTVPTGATITYVRVTVNSISPPKVDYEADTNQVSIVYDWTQITYSTYSIVVKDTDGSQEWIPKILAYEYGKRIFGDTLSYVYVGMVPAYQPYYNFSVKPPFLGIPDMKKQITYLRVHYSNPMSKVNISYNPKISMLEFFIKYPFMSFPFGIDAYASLTLASERVTVCKSKYNKSMI